MKKILSLLSMLMITVTAFATSYTDQLSYKLTVFTALTKNLPAGELTVEPYGTSNYTVTAKGCDFSDFDAGNWDEIVCEDVAGTTDANGVTTITLDNPYAFRTSDNTAFTDTKLVVKFNGTKAYAHFEGKMKVMYVARAFEYTFGTDEGFESTGGGSTGGEVTEKYTVNFDKTAYHSRNDRVLSSFSLQQTGKDKQTMNVLASKAAYEDHTAEKFTVEAGSELTASFNYSGQWMNGYVYIDRDNDGEFSYKEGQWDQAGTDLVAYSFYSTLTNPKVNDGSGYNSTGASVTGDDRSNVNPPSFTAPTEPGTYRIRFKIDWNCILPGGSSDILSDGGGVWDATLEVVAAEPEVTVTFEKQYADQLYSLADGTPSAMGDATVTLKEMSDNTISMSLTFSNMNVESTDLVKGTDEKDRITYTGTANFQGTNFAVKALRYTKDEEEKLYMTLTATDGTTLAFGTDPDYVAPAEPEDVTLWENYQADGTGFSKTTTINWDKQKIVASIDFSNGGDDKDILAMTTGESFAAFQTSTYRTMHWYCQQSVKQMSGFFAKDGAGNNNTGRMDVADCLAKFEISKAEGLKVNGEVKMSPEVLDELFASNTVLIGSGESPKFSKAFYNYIKVVSLDWTETTTPDTPEAVVYNNDLTIVRDADHKVYENAEVTVLAKGEGKYEVTLPEFSDMDLANAGTVGKIVFEANGEEVDGVLQLTAENAAGVISTGEAWSNYAADVTMSGEVENGQLAAKFTVVLGGMSDYTYELGFGKEIFIPATETITDWANVKFGESDPVNIENAKLDITMVSASTAKLTFKDVVINGNTIGDFAISDVKASLNPEDYTTILTTEATKGTWVRTVENNALGVIVGAESDIRNFEGSQDEEAGKTIVKFGVFFGSAYGWADIVFGEKVDTPEPPVVEDYDINFDKDAKQTHGSRYSTSVSLQQEGKDKQTIEFGKTMNGYEDLTAGTEKFTVEAGSEVTPSIGYVGEWMHGYVYIDLDNNKQFSFNADGADQTGTEVVSYSYYRDQNSKGESASSNCNVNPMPAFTAPTTPGTYRIRFKVDWDNIDAGGSVASGNYILNNGGGIYDATLEVVEPVVDGISTINAEVANGEAQLFTVDGVQIAKLQKGLNIVRTADGKVKKVLVK